MSARIAPAIERRRMVFVIDVDLFDETLLEEGSSVLLETFADGFGTVHALSGELVSLSGHGEYLKRMRAVYRAESDQARAERNEAQAKSLEAGP